MHYVAMEMATCQQPKKTFPTYKQCDASWRRRLPPQTSYGLFAALNHGIFAYLENKDEGRTAQQTAKDMILDSYDSFTRYLHLSRFISKGYIRQKNAGFARTWRKRRFKI